ncbi:hypothetical protein HYW59_05000 [Candidatus Kaiserbacteria bacterium]|nr:hypothetical protein [Candidatus Kaiserbacteria bacterium]
MTNIMLVDADQTRRDLAQTALIGHDHIVTALGDSADALASLRLGGWDLLITTDPGLIKAVQADPNLKDLNFMGDPTGELVDGLAKGRPLV